MTSFDPSLRLLLERPKETLRALDILDGEESLLAFTKRLWPVLEPHTPFVDGWALEAICEHLEAVTDGQINRLLMNVPPGFSKSLMTNVFWPAWEWSAQNLAHHRFVTFSYAASLTERDNRRFLDLLKSQEFQWLWGDRFQLKKAGETLVSNDKTGWKLASSVGGVGTGERGDRILCFPADQLVQTEIGPVPIGKIVRDRLALRVWSTNVISGETGLKPITGWRRNPGSKILEVGFSDGTTLRCTPDHRVWTNRGWVEARSLFSGDMLPCFRDLDVSDGVPCHPKSRRQNNIILSAPIDFDDGAVGELAATDRATARVIAVAPDAGGNVGPIDPLADLADCLGLDPIPSSESGGALATTHDLDYVLLGELRIRALLVERERPVPLGVVDIFGAGAVGQIGDAIVGRVAIQVPNIVSDRSQPDKCSGDNLVDEQVVRAVVAPCIESEISFPVRGCPQYLLSNCQGVSASGDDPGVASDTAVTTDAIAPLKPNYRSPLFIREVGHADETFCLSVEGNHTFYCGSGKGVLVSNCDDPHNVKESESDVVRSETVRWFREAMSNRLNDMERSAIVVIMQRVHEADVSGAILESAADYTHLMIPMEYDGRRYNTSIGWTDPREDDGDLAWPDRFSERVVADIKSVAGPYAYSGQYQQLPTPRGGGIFREEWWQLWGNESDPADIRNRTFPACEYIVTSLDPAYTEKEENDYSAVTVWGVFRDERSEGDYPKIILLHAWRDRLAIHDLVERCAETCRRFKADRLLIEAKASGISVAQEIRRLYAGESFGVQLVDPKGKDKVARANAVAPLFSDGIVYAPYLKFSKGSWGPRDWADMVMQEMKSFPRAPHDDLVDSSTMALNHLRKVGLAVHEAEIKRELADEMMFRPEPKPLYGAI